MSKQCELSTATKNYLAEFHCILNRMVSGMTSAELNNSISHNFIVQMIPHHQAAIEMSENILKYTNNPELKNIASGIITEQKKSIENMCSIECICEKPENSEKALNSYEHNMRNIMYKMFCRMENANENNRVNCNFMYEMIPHHIGAVEMSELTLKYDICKQLKPILYAIIRSQKEGIEEMRNLLKCIDC